MQVGNLVKIGGIEIEAETGIATIIEGDETQVRIITGEDPDPGQETVTEGGIQGVGKGDTMSEVTENGEKTEGVEVFRHTIKNGMIGEMVTTIVGGDGNLSVTGSGIARRLMIPLEQQPNP
jgi:uncharacterized protein YidB (DUF937 family)